MSKEDLEKQIELLVKDDEISQQTIINQRQEIERLKSIIKEAIEYINNEQKYYEYDFDYILEILDKGKE